MKRIFLLFVFIGSLQTGYAQDLFKNNKGKQSSYEEIDFEGMMRKYFSKEAGPLNGIEGIYSVSCIITRRTRGLFSGIERDKVMERKDNYARVAILKDWPGTNREYVEVSLSFKEALKYPIVGEMNSLSEGNGLIYRHYEPGETGMDFTMVATHTDLLEGVYTLTKRRKLITYSLTYLKIYPKQASEVSRK